MSWIIGAVTVSLGILFLWGLLSPRSQWRVLAAWSVSDQHRNEPGGAGYGIRRLVSALGLAAMLTVVLLAIVPGITAQFAQSATAKNPVQQMWGSPTPQLVDRVVHPAGAAPEGLVDIPVLAYQAINEDSETVPAYLLAMRHFTMLGKSEIPGYIGSEAAEEQSAIGTADLVVQVRGPVLCVPRVAVVGESETVVQVAIFYGRPDPAEGQPAPDNATECNPDDPNTGSVLIPVTLSAPVGDREVQTFAAAPIPSVPIIKR